MRFHSRLNAVSKTYCYRIETAAKKNVFERRYVYGLGEPLDIASMRRAAAYLTGEHDFKAFCSLKRIKKSTVRNLTAIDLTMQESVCELHFRGNGFLYNMVRILTGTLIEVGLPVTERWQALRRRRRGFFWNGSSMNKAALIFASCREELDRNQKKFITNAIRTGFSALSYIERKFRPCF